MLPTVPNLFLYFFCSLHLFTHSEVVTALSWHTPNTHFHHLFYHHFCQSLLLKLIHLCELLQRPFDQQVNVTLLFGRKHIQLQRRTVRFKPALQEIFTEKWQKKKSKAILFKNTSLLEIKASSDGVREFNSIHYCASGKEKRLIWNGLPTSQECCYLCLL